MFRVRTQLVGGAGGAQVNTLYFSSFPGRTAAASALAAANFWGNLVGAMTSEYTAITEADVYTLDDATGTITGSTTVTSYTLPGTNAGDPLPWMTQGLISWNSGLYVAGRLVKGRTFVPGPSELHNTDGVPNSTYTDALETAISDLLADADAELFIWSRKNGDTYPVIGGSVGTVWSYLSSRRS